MTDKQNKHLSRLAASDKATQLMCEYTCSETWDELVDDEWSSVDVHDILMRAFLSQNEDTH